MNLNIPWLTYLIITSLLLAAELLYFKLADFFNIIDKPNQRSSHQIPTIRGGGIVFPLSILLYSVVYRFPYPYLVTGVCLSAAISFLDDVREVNPLLRFSVHLLTVASLFFELPVSALPWWAIGLLAFIALGSINMYNFMDGINGITAFYTLSILIPLILTEPESNLLQMQIFFGIGVLVFTFFNARKRARCFAGDIGSICAAVILLFFIAQRMLSAHTLVPLGHFSVYVIDAGYTVVERLIKKENIFKPHRSHLYQLLCNEIGLQHIHVSLIYAVIQLMLNMVVLYSDIHFVTLIGIGIGMLVLYHVIKQRTKQIVQKA